LQDGYADTFAELMQATEWSHYGSESGNPKCANCMVHSGYEASAVDQTFSSLKGLVATVRATLFSRYEDADAMSALDQPQKSVFMPDTLVKIGSSRPESKEVEA
jgi:hypothetical protein